MNGAGIGRIAFPGSQGAIERATVEFIRTQLAPWRDDPHRERVAAEDRLNGQLCKYLNVAARQHFPMVLFHHEERQGGRHRVDIAVLPARAIWVGSRQHTVYDPFLVIEGKRLPAPRGDREREYVTGRKRPTGGIQRFKLGLHGADHEISAMIGYLQEGSSSHWVETINSWLCELAEQKAAGKVDWCDDEPLRFVNVDSASDVATLESAHQRVAASSHALRIYHLWVGLPSQPKAAKP